MERSMVAQRGAGKDTVVTTTVMMTVVAAVVLMTMATANIS